jgi:hypothetical protein
LKSLALAAVAVVGKVLPLHNLAAQAAVAVAVIGAKLLTHLLSLEHRSQ